MNGYVCFLKLERDGAFAAHTLHVPLPWKPVNLFTIVIVTHNLGPRRLNPQRQLFPCRGGCAPCTAGCSPQAPAARGAPRARLAQAHARFRSSAWRRACVAMATGNACQARWVPAPPCWFSETESLLLVPQHVGEILLTLGANRGPNSKSRLGRLAVQESAGRRAKAISQPRGSHRQRRALPSSAAPYSLPPAIPDAAEGHVV